MELKCPNLKLKQRLHTSSNRTFMELKFGEGGVINNVFEF